jgi:hypothetical protein
LSFCLHFGLLWRHQLRDVCLTSCLFFLHDFFFFCIHELRTYHIAYCPNIVHFRNSVFFQTIIVRNKNLFKYPCPFFFLISIIVQSATSLLTLVYSFLSDHPLDIRTPALSLASLPSPITSFHPSQSFQFFGPFVTLLNCVVNSRRSSSSSISRLQY